MSYRKQNIRKACDKIDNIGRILKHNIKIDYAIIGQELIFLARKIKRTTWRGDK